ncbi:hypothetical protein EON65_23170, partial [archaeon]
GGGGKGDGEDCIRSVLSVYHKALAGNGDAIRAIQIALTTLTLTNNLTIISISMHNHHLLISVYGDGVCENVCMGDGDGCMKVMEEYVKVIEESDSTLVRQEEIGGEDKSGGGVGEGDGEKKSSKEGSKVGAKGGSKGEGNGEGKAKGGTMSEKEKKDWWAKRERTDQNLHDNMVMMQTYLQPLLDILNRYACSGGNTDVDKVTQGMQGMEIGEGMGEGDEDDDECSSGMYEDMKVTDLRTLSKARGLSAIGRKQDIIERLVQQDIEKKKERGGGKGKGKAGDMCCDGGSQTNDCSSMGSSKGDGHILFILDEHLTSYPLESLPYFRDRACSRLPSLLVLLGLLHKQGGIGGKSADIHTHTPASSDIKTMKPSRIPKAKQPSSSLLSIPSSPSSSPSPPADISRCWYAVDIENNLPTTRDTMLGYMQGYVQRGGWVGVVGSVPESEVVR